MECREFFLRRHFSIETRTCRSMAAPRAGKSRAEKRYIDVCREIWKTYVMKTLSTSNLQHIICRCAAKQRGLNQPTDIWVEYEHIELWLHISEVSHFWI
jgi:hypothetical protein